MQKFQQHGMIFVDLFPDFSSAAHLGLRMTKDPGALASQEFSAVPSLWEG